MDISLSFLGNNSPFSKQIISFFLLFYALLRAQTIVSLHHFLSFVDVNNFCLLQYFPLTVLSSIYTFKIDRYIYSLYPSVSLALSMSSVCQFSNILCCCEYLSTKVHIIIMFPAKRSQVILVWCVCVFLLIMLLESSEVGGESLGNVQKTNALRMQLHRVDLGVCFKATVFSGFNFKLISKQRLATFKYISLNLTFIRIWVVHFAFY